MNFIKLMQLEWTYCTMFHITWCDNHYIYSQQEHTIYEYLLDGGSEFSSGWNAEYSSSSDSNSASSATLPLVPSSVNNDHIYIQNTTSRDVEYLFRNWRLVQRRALLLKQKQTVTTTIFKRLHHVMWNTLSTTNPLFFLGYCFWNNELCIVLFSSAYTCL